MVVAKSILLAVLLLNAAANVNYLGSTGCQDPTLAFAVLANSSVYHKYEMLQLLLSRDLGDTAGTTLLGELAQRIYTIVYS